MARPFTIKQNVMFQGGMHSEKLIKFKMANPDTNIPGIIKYGKPCLIATVYHFYKTKCVVLEDDAP